MSKVLNYYQNRYKNWKKMRVIFRKARQAAHYIIFLGNIDAIIRTQAVEILASRMSVSAS